MVLKLVLNCAIMIMSVVRQVLTMEVLCYLPGGGYSHTLFIRVCAAQRGRDFEASDLERGIHFKGVF